MRLSEIRGERVFDVIADIVDPIANMASDGAVMLLFDKEAPDGMDARQFAVFKARKVIPHLINHHRKDVVAVLSTLNNVTPEEYVNGMSMGSLAKDLFEMLTDTELLAFLS